MKKLNFAKKKFPELNQRIFFQPFLKDQHETKTC